MAVKTDRKDARGLAQLIRMGWFRPVHAKSIRSQEVRALLVARKQLLGRLSDVELSIWGILRGFGLKVGPNGNISVAAPAPLNEFRRQYPDISLLDEGVRIKFDTAE